MKFDFGSWKVFFGLMLLMTIMHLPFVYFPLGKDQGIWTSLGMAVKDGHVFYRDILHFHFPGLAIALAGAFHFTENPAAAVMLVNLFGFIVMLVAIRGLVSTVATNTAANWACLLFVIQLTSLTNYQRIAQKDVMAIAGVALACYLMALAVPACSAKRRLVLNYFAGVSVLVFAMFKPLVVMAGPIMALVHFLRFVESDEPSYSFSQCFTELSALLAGALTVIGLGLLYLVANDALADMYFAVFDVAATYTSINPKPFSKMMLTVLYGTLGIGIGNPIFWLVLLCLNEFYLPFCPPYKFYVAV